MRLRLNKQNTPSEVQDRKSKATMSSTADWHVQDLLDWLHGFFPDDCKDSHNEVVSRQNGRCATDYWRTSDPDECFYFTVLQAPLRVELTVWRILRFWFTYLFIHGLAFADATGLAAGLEWTWLTFSSQKPNPGAGAKEQPAVLVFNESLITSTPPSCEAVHYPPNSYALILSKGLQGAARILTGLNANQTRCLRDGSARCQLSDPQPILLPFIGCQSERKY